MEEQALKCTKKIVRSPTGYSPKVKCGKPVYQNGLCKHHYTRSIEKQACWGERPGYREATQDDLDRGRSLKMKDSRVHQLYRFRKGFIEKFHSETNTWYVTDLSPIVSLFVVKN